MSVDTLPDDDALLLTVDEVCRKLRVSRSTVYELVKTGDLKSATIRRTRRFRRADVEAYIARLYA
jgi:excisionase family DNA binding protein